MDKYSKKALKITVLLFLSLFSFTLLIGFGHALDFKRKTDIWHYCVTVKWTLRSQLDVNYNNDDGDLITGWTTSGSGDFVNDITNWYSYGYTYSLTKSEKYGVGYTWVQLYNYAHFRTKTDDNHVIAYAICKIYNHYSSWGTAYFEQLYGGYLYIVWSHGA